MLGSVAETTLRDAPCNVLAILPQATVAPADARAAEAAELPGAAAEGKADRAKGWWLEPWPSLPPAFGRRGFATSRVGEKLGE